MSNVLLEEAIARYQIPAWPYEAAYDRVIVFSLPEEKALRDTYIEGGVIAKPESKRQAERNETPRGVLVSAGLGARDVLYSHCMGLGHIVWVARLSPWRHEVEMGRDGKPVEFLFLRVGDIVGSETLQSYIRQGHVKVGRDSCERHYFESLDGHALPRFDPPSYVA